MARASDIRAGGAFVELMLSDKAYLRGLMNAQAKLMRFSAAVTKAGKQMMMAGAGITGIFAAAAKSYAAMGDELHKMSSRIGASVEFLSALGHAAQIGGTDIGAMEVGFRRLQRTAYDATRGLTTAVDAFADLGVVITNADGKLKTTEALFMEVAAALSRVDNNTKKAALSTVVFGRAGTSLLPMLTQGKAGLLALMEEAKRLGIVMSTEDATAAAEFTDVMTRLWAVIKRVTFEIGRAAADVFQKYADKLTAISKTVGEWIRDHASLIATTLKWGVGLMAAGAALTLVGKLAAVAAAATKALAVAMALVLANPMAAVLLGTAAAAALVANEIRKATSHVADLRDEMRGLREEGDKQRATDIDRMTRLEQLADKEKLNNLEMGEAKGLIGKLENKYGDLGLAINSVTGAIEGMVEAQKAMNKEMAVRAYAQVHKELADIEHNLDELAKQAHSFLRREMPRLTGAGWSGESVSTEQGGLYSASEWQKMLDLYKERERLQIRAAEIKGGVPGSLTGAEPKDDIKARIDAELAKGEAVEDFEADMVARLQRLWIEAIDDKHKRALAAIDLQYGKELQRAKELGADTARLREAWDQAAANEKARHQKELADEQQRLDEERADRQTQLQEDVERLEIQASKKGLDRRLALINLEEQRAIAAANKSGDVWLINDIRRKHELQREVARQGAERSKDPRTGAQGTFNPWAVRGMGTGRVEERMAKELATMRQQNAKLIEINENQLRAFRQGMLVT